MVLKWLINRKFIQSHVELDINFDVWIWVGHVYKLFHHDDMTNNIIVNR